MINTSTKTENTFSDTCGPLVPVVDFRWGKNKNFKGQINNEHTKMYSYHADHTSHDPLCQLS